ncbi:MAG: amidohydrolase family protein [Pyrinomonadaceae bacterium]|nr:amidohydrolase family protein [Pyrinomonadaceae bacterium]
MRKKLALLLAFLLPPLAGAQTKPVAQSRPLVFTHATVIDTTGGPPKSDSTVIVAGNRIVAFGKTGRVRIPEGAQVVNAADKFLLPGLWDMHFHSPEDQQAREIFLPLAIANGVTGVRHMFGSEALLKQRDEVLSGTLLGPRMIVGSPVVDGPTPMWVGSVSVADAPAGRQAVRTLKQRGYDFIKVYQFLPREVYLAIADEARKQNIVFAGHVPFSVSAAEASDAGQKSFEHIFGMSLACSAREDSLRPALAEAAAHVGKAFDAHIELFIRNESEPVASYNEQKAAALFKRLAGNGTYAMPTLVLHRSLASGADPAFRNDPRLKYMPPNIRRLFDWELRFFTSYQPVYERQLLTTGAMHRAGVKVLAGTDTFNAYCFPGFSLHDELELFVQAGFTPLEALQTATLNPARYLGLSSSLGTIEKGKIADLILLEANPLENVGNTRKIAAVVANGRYLPKESLRRMLETVESMANKR